MRDNYTLDHDPVFAPATKPVAVTPHDADPLPAVPRRIFIGTGGNITLRGVDAETDVTYKNLGDGVYLNVRPSHIRSTGTTASDIIAEI